MSIYFKWIVEHDLFNKVLICDLVHDEAVIEAPEDLIQLASDKLKEAMEKGASVLCKSLPIPAVPEIGNHWIH